MFFWIYLGVLCTLGIIAGALGARRREEEMVYTILLTCVGFSLKLPTGWLWYEYVGVGLFFLLSYVLSAKMIPSPVTKTKDTLSPKVAGPDTNSSHSYGPDFHII